MNSLAEQIIVDILNFEMKMPENSVWIRDQNFKFDYSDGLFIVVGMVDANVIGAQSYMQQREIPNPPDPDIIQQWEIQESITRESIQIDILSRNTEALFRRWEIISALKSFYSQQKQEENSFTIFYIPNAFINASDAEGGSRINRFSIRISCNVWYRKEKLLELPNGDYYDDFSTRVDDAQTIGTDQGIIEFRITAED